MVDDENDRVERVGVGGGGRRSEEERSKVEKVQLFIALLKDFESPRDIGESM